MIRRSLGAGVAVVALASMATGLLLVPSARVAPTMAVRGIHRESPSVPARRAGEAKIAGDKPLPAARERASVPRRSFLGVTVGATCVLGDPLAPVSAIDEAPAEPRACNEALYTLLRVQEATQQEERLVRTGKFKDLQRANIKLAVNLILKNYGLVDAVTSASTLSSSALEASQVGRDAVEALQQILEYFDASSRSLNVETLAGDKLDFVLRALSAANRKLETFLSYMPDAEVAKARAVVEQENSKNLAEFKAANPDEPAYLNPPPKK